MLQNRINPFGEVVAVAGRGTLLGNRGVLHDEHQRIVRYAAVRRWIACVTEFRGRKRTVMTPKRYTELFFLDDATAFAAGHRPCAECRNADYALQARATSTRLAPTTSTKSRRRAPRRPEEANAPVCVWRSS